MATFRHLPSEVKEMVVEALCAHCSSKLPPDAWNTRCDCIGGHADQDPKSDDAALTGLCLASKELNEMATRHLYHQSTFRKWWWLFARTMITRPDLAQHILIPPEVSECYASKEQDFVRRLRALPSDENDIKISEENLNLTPLSRPALNIVASLCPNTETLVAELPCAAFRAFKFFAPDLLMALKTLDIRYQDTYYGTSMSYFQAVLHVVPNLTTLCCQALDGVGKVTVTLPHVTYIRLPRSGLNDDDLRTMLACCPSVKRFEYWCGGPIVTFEQFAPWEARDLLLELALNLKRVLRDFEMDDPYMRDTIDEQDEGIEESFQGRGIQFVKEAVDSEFG
ncbi:hypothetical protein B0H63DRAFT_565115 [Podospora didyma]|uniref:Uncharacterized protein n=1 Tax=Podospora didyma TaxID=330526 RepID=A0AAE0K1P3_9PEZI|nr:hypothetical protein B0H63DRAFT_565115 [Podospora didyma]